MENCMKNQSRIDFDFYLSDKLFRASRLPLLSTVRHCQHMRKFDQICLLQYKFPLSLFYLNRKFVYSPNLWVLQLSWNLQRATVHNDAMLYARAPQGEQKASCILAVMC